MAIYARPGVSKTGVSQLRSEIVCDSGGYHIPTLCRKYQVTSLFREQEQDLLSN